MTSGSCLDGLSLALSQISFAVTELSKKNFKNNVHELKSLVQKYGPEAERHLLRCLFSCIDFNNEKIANRDSPQVQFLAQECQELVTKPNFVSLLCYSIDNPESSQKTIKATSHFFTQLTKFLKLTKVQEVVFGIALQNSANPDFRTYASQFVKQKLPDLVKAYIDSDVGSSQESVGLSDVAIEVLHLLLSYLLNSSKQEVAVKPEQLKGFLDSLRRDFPKERVPIVLAPLLYPEDKSREEDEIRLSLETGGMPRPGGDANLCDVMEELGYSCCSSHEECRETLTQFGVGNLNPNCIARVFGMMARTATGLDGAGVLQTTSNVSRRDDKMPLTHSWNVEIFVDCLKDIVPALNWRQVIHELDHPGFLIKGPDGVRIIVLGFLRATNELFPVDAIYKPWSNTQGQLSWIEHSLNDLRTFCFADYPCHYVVIDILKSPPDDSNKEIATWKSLDLVEALLRLAEAGHYEAVLKLFAYPVKNCPDVLLLDLLQVNTTWHTLRNDLVSMLMPLFLGNHPNSMSVLHYAWHGQGQSPTIRQLVMQAMADWYMKADAKGDQVEQQTRLSRILDVAQDLKALSMLLSSTPFTFVIDLAALASRREYLKLDKWLNDKMREHQEPFSVALTNYLKKRCPQLAGITPDKELPKAVQLPTETVATMLSCLQMHIGSFSMDLAETVKTLINNHGPLMKARPSLNLGMPMKRPTGLDSGLGTPPIGSQADPFSSSFSATSGSSQLPGFGSSHPLAGTPLGSASTFSGLGSLTSNIQPPKQPQLGGLFSGLPSSSALSGNGPSVGASTQNTFMQQYQQGSLSQSNSMIGGTPVDSLQSLASSVGSIGQHKRNPLSSSLSGFSSFQQQQASMAQSRQQAEARLKQVATGDLSAVFPGMDQNFSKEIEDEANSYFQRIYNQPPNPTMSIDEVLEMLKRFKDSPVKKERDVFLCMLRNLFEEYRFFPQYPDKELHITACLFGGIIEQGLVTYMALGIALRYVLEALRKGPASKLSMFGTTALDRFKKRLKDYPHYCQHLASIPHFKDFPQHLIDYIVYGQRSQEPPGAVRASQNESPLFGRPTTTVASGANRMPGLPSSSPGPLQSSSLLSTGPAAKTTTTVTSVVSSVPSTGTATSTASTAARKEPSIANTTNIDTLLGATEQADLKQPPDAIQDKVHFIFNNISQSNMTTKAEELKGLIQKEFYPWLAQYLVMKRVSIEPNFHQLYTDFLGVLKIDEVSEAVLQETFRNIKVLLRSDKGPANFSDRSLLKNLGHWLGMLTLSNNKPILFQDLEVKSLLIEAFFKGQQELLYVVPFVAKVLECCAKSKVFKPPNPWLMGVMGVLAELHQLQDLKLTLKFEVEVLCNTLSLDLKEITPTEFLKDPEILNTVEHQLSIPEKEKSGASGAGAQQQTMGPPPPLFGYHEISVTNLAGLAPHIQINPNILLFQQYPHLKQCIRPAIERAVQELLLPVVERAIKICLMTAEMIVKKDFALDPEESRMRTAAHHMVRNITAGMGMITCKEPLQLSLNTHIKSNLTATLRSANAQQKEQLEQAALMVANDNLELACAFIQKSAVERALMEIDKRLATEYELRKHARGENRRYCDPYVLTYQAERMPEQIRLKVGGVTSSQMSVFEEFARSIPGFLPPEASGAPSEPFPKPMQEPMGSLFNTTSSDQHVLMPDDVVHILGKCAAEIEQHIHHMEQQMHQLMAPPTNPHLTQLHNLLDMVVNARVTRDNISALRLIRKLGLLRRRFFRIICYENMQEIQMTVERLAVEGILETILPGDTEMALRYKDCHLIVLRGFQDPRGYGPLWTARQVIKTMADLPAEVRFNLEGNDILIRAHLINMRDYDVLLAQWLEGGHNYQAVHFAIHLCRLYLVEEKNRPFLSENDLSSTLEVLSRVSQRQQNTEGLSSLLENVHPPTTQQSFMGHFPGDLEKSAPSTAPSMGHGLLGHEFEDPPGLQEKVDYLLREWVRLYHHASAGRYSEKAFQAIVPQLHTYGILKTDDLITRFFRLCTEMCVDITYRALGEYSTNPGMARTKCFATVDAYCRLICLLVKHSGDASNSVTKINLLNRVLGIVGTVLLQDHELKQLEFHQLAYHRMFVVLLLELNAPEPVLEAINFQILHCFGNVLHDLRPSRAPGFAYAWLELVAHRTLMSKLLLNSPQQKGWVLYHQLLIDLFKFLASFLRNVELAKQTHLLYKGTLRVLLVLLHDFPEFLCDYHFSFCDVIPPNCIQMRNLILSAFPRNMRLPDPFTPNLKVDLLSDIAHAPRILTNFAGAIQPPSFKKDLDSYLKTRAPVTFLSELRSHLQISNEPGTRYNVPLMNALVLYVGTQAIAYIQSKSGTPSISTITHSSHMDIFQNLAVDLDTEGRYLFLNAIANQLRYPNSHTHYFSCTLLYLFAEANSEAIQEQITRVLLERLIVNRPHPWGLLITFIELIKNHNYKFWNHDFVHCAPEIEKLFESVARSCMQQKQPQSRNGNDSQE